MCRLLRTWLRPWQARLHEFVEGGCSDGDGGKAVWKAARGGSGHGGVGSEGAVVGTSIAVVADVLMGLMHGRLRALHGGHVRRGR